MTPAKRNAGKIAGKKAIIFTIDAILALILGLSIILASLFYLGKASAPSQGETLQLISQDALAVMEKNGQLSESVSGATALPLESAIDMLPPNTCARLAVYSSLHEKISETLRQNCRFSEDYVLTRRLFVSEGNLYYAEMEAWYR